MEHKRLLRRFIEEVWNSGNFDNLSTLVSFPYTVLEDPRDPWDKQALNTDAFIYRVMYSRNAFPDLAFEIHEMVQESDTISVRWTMEGTHTGDLPLLEATGKTFSAGGISFYYFKDGKLKGHRQHYDQLGFLLDMGVFPAA